MWGFVLSHFCNQKSMVHDTLQATTGVNNAYTVRLLFTWLLLTAR